MELIPQYSLCFSTSDIIFDLDRGSFRGVFLASHRDLQLREVIYLSKLVTQSLKGMQKSTLIKQLEIKVRKQLAWEW